VNDAATSTRRVARAILMGFIAVAVGLGYWQVAAAPELLATSKYSYTRQAYAESNIVRGRILDRNGVVLAQQEGTGDDSRRVYTYPGLVHAVGYHDPKYGDYAIEDAFSSYLNGSAGQSLSALLATEALHRPSVGSDVVLTIDSRIQQVADAALGDGPGAVVVMNPKTGEILALASHPYFDPNTLQLDYPQLVKAADNPLFDRATLGLYPPGSTFKTITVSAGLELGYYSKETLFTCDSQIYVEGFPVRCEEYNQGTFNLVHAYAFSCNACFGQMGLRIGGRDLTEYARRFGFEARIPFELPTSASQVARSDPETRLIGTLLASTAFGQGELLTSPLQMALVAAAAGNGGVVPTPRLVSQVKSPDGTVVFATSYRPWKTAMRQDTARALLDLMVAGVEGGLASNAAVPGFRIGGKTGTAEVAPGRPTHAWFIGVAPAENPQLAIAVIKEYGGGGGTVATPIAQKVLAQALSLVAGRR